MVLLTKSLISQVESLKEEGEIFGYASVFDHVDMHNDKIRKGAFKDSILNHQKGELIKLLWQHDQAQPIGYIQNIYEDNYGLVIKAKLLSKEIEKAKEIYALIKSKIINSLSIGFKVVDHFYDRSEKCRIITNLELWEISFVTFPANKKARITNVKSLPKQHLSLSIDKAINILKLKK